MGHFSRSGKKSDDIAIELFPFPRRPRLAKNTFVRLGKNQLTTKEDFFRNGKNINCDPTGIRLSLLRSFDVKAGKGDTGVNFAADLPGSLP